MGKKYKKIQTHLEDYKGLKADAEKQTSSFFDKLVTSRVSHFAVIPAKAGIQLILKVLDAGSVIPDLIRDRHDGFGTFYEFVKFTNIFIAQLSLTGCCCY